MKPKINYYLIKLAKENVVYLISWVIIFFIIFICAILFSNKFLSINQKINQTKTEASGLKEKADLVNYKEEIINEGINLDEVNKVFTRLIPNEEDFFSIIVALDTISKKTNFIITGYSINLQTTNKNKLALTIGGAGDNEAFFNFLRDYRYVGGRLITIDKINYNTTTFAQTQLGVNFYNGNESKSTLITAAKLSQADKKLIKEILNKVTLELKGGDEDKSASSSAYSIKNNPF